MIMVIIKQVVTYRQIYKDNYESVVKNHSPKIVREDFRRNYGVELSYWKLGKARESSLRIVRGSLEESYIELLFYCSLLEAMNPSIIIHMHLDDGNNFVDYFMALRLCFRDFEGNIRFVICLDRTILKSIYKKTLFVTTCLDGNN